MDDLLRRVEDGELSPLVAQKAVERKINDLKQELSGCYSIYNLIDRYIFDNFTTEEIEELFKIYKRTYKK